jgi:GNAT superfamily N-acetyltransferase
MDYEIRGFHHADIPHLMEICLKTGNDGEDGSDLYSDPYFIGQLYVLPYVMYNPEMCLIVHHGELPVGYILGTADTESLYAWMENRYFPTLRRRYPSTMKCTSAIEEFFISRLHSDRSLVEVDPRFPAHVHINLLPVAQGLGLGSKLIKGFLDKLADQGCPGVYVHTGSQNKAAITFYQKKGFQIVDENSDSVKLAASLM